MTSSTSLLHLVMLTFSAGCVTLATAQECPPSLDLPAYSHNDYANPRPLHDALALGYRGVEVDIFLAGRELVVAHDRRSMRRGRTFESLYLRPLSNLLARCGRRWLGPRPFLLNVELKEASRAAFDHLLAMFRGYPSLFEAGQMQPPQVEVVLVGWHPPAGELTNLPDYVHLQQRISSRGSAPGPHPTDRIRLISLNYGKTIGWNGRGSEPASLEEWLGALRRARDAAPGRMVRVFNVPVDATVYRRLLRGGVDLVGVKELKRGRQAMVKQEERSG